MATKSDKTAPPTGNPLIRRMLSGGAVVVSGGSLAQLLLIAAELAWARHLGTAGFGLFSIGLALTLVASSLCQCGTQIGIVQFLARFVESRQPNRIGTVIGTGLLFVACTATVCGATLVVFSQSIAAGIFGKEGLAPILTLVGLTLPIEAVNQCLAATFRGLREYRHDVVCSRLLRNTVLLVGIPIALALDLGPVGASCAVLIGCSLATVYGAYQLLKLARNNQWRLRFELPMLRELLGFSWLLMLADMLRVSTPRILILVGGTLLASSEVGVLAVITKLIVLLNFPQVAVNTTSSVEFARLWYREELEQFKRVAQTLYAFLATASLAIVLPLMVDPSGVLNLFGPGFAPYGWAAMLLVGSKLINSPNAPLPGMLVASHRQRVVFSFTLLEFLLIPALVLPSMYWGGLAGAVCGESLRTIIVAIVRYVAASSLFSVSILRREIAWPCLVAAVAVLVGRAVGGWTGDIAAPVPAAAAATLLYCGVMANIIWKLIARHRRTESDTDRTNPAPVLASGNSSRAA